MRIIFHLIHGLFLIDALEAVLRPYQGAIFCYLLPPGSASAPPGAINGSPYRGKDMALWV